MFVRIGKAMPFAVIGGLEILGAVKLGSRWPLLAALLLWTGMTTGWVAVAYGLGRADLLGKKWCGYLPLAPFSATAATAARVGQRIGIPERSEVAPGVWVGGWPRARSETWAQLDCTAELPRRGTSQKYACYPMLDGLPVPRGALTSAIRQVRAWRGEGRTVLIHCAFGHGRSVAVACGVLVLDGEDDTVNAALARIRRLRPGARLDVHQRAAIEDAITDIRSGDSSVEASESP